MAAGARCLWRAGHQLLRSSICSAPVLDVLQQRALLSCIGCCRARCSPTSTLTSIPVTPTPTRPQIEESGAERSKMVDSLNVSVASGILLHRLLTAQAAPSEAVAPAAAAAVE